MVFAIGDKVVYPVHGAGVIEGIEEKEIMGEKNDYYVMRLPIENMNVLIPMDHAGDIGLREVINDEGVKKVLNILQEHKTEMSTNWNRRYRINMDKIKSGDIFEVAEVVRNLSLRDKEKGLSTGERKMLDSAKQILISEIVLAKDIQKEQAQTIIEQSFA